MRSGELVGELRALVGQGTAYLLLAEAVRGLVLDGRLVAGERVPSERGLAHDLHVSRTTVSAAYERLRADGYLSSRQGAGTTVSLPRVDVDRPDESGRRAPIDIDLTIAALPAPASLGPLVAAAADRLPRHLAGHGLHPLGLPALRAAVADRFSRRGLDTSPSQILITQGALHAWDLALRALAAPGNSIVIEQPSYPGVIDAIRAHRCRPVALGVDASRWASPPRRARPPTLAHVIADHHNPTGHHATADERRSLSRALATTTIAVDETFADLTLDGSTVPPFASLSARRPILSMGSLNKAVWSGLRVGWIRADPSVLTRIVAARTSQDSASPVLEQLVAVEILAQYPHLIAERQQTLRHRRDHLVRELARTRPEWTFVVPSGGVALWVDLGSRSSARLSVEARRVGVRVPPGGRFSIAGTHDRFLRIPFTQPESVLTEVVARLADAESHTEPHTEPHTESHTESRARRSTSDAAGTWTA